MYTVAQQNPPARALLRVAVKSIECGVWHGDELQRPDPDAYASTPTLHRSRLLLGSFQFSRPTCPVRYTSIDQCLNLCDDSVYDCVYGAFRCYHLFDVWQSLSINTQPSDTKPELCCATDGHCRRNRRPPHTDSRTRTIIMRHGIPSPAAFGRHHPACTPDELLTVSSTPARHCRHRPRTRHHVCLSIILLYPLPPLPPIHAFRALPCTKRPNSVGLNGRRRHPRKRPAGACASDRPPRAPLPA